MDWLKLLAAGILESFWAWGMKSTDGFTKPMPTVLVIGGMVLSFWLLSQAMKTLPAGTAYAVWVGIGAVGAVILGISFSNEPATPARLFFLALLIIAVAGLRLTHTEASKGEPPVATETAQGDS